MNGKEAATMTKPLAALNQLLVHRLCIPAVPLRNEWEVHGEESHRSAENAMKNLSNAAQTPVSQ
jgi:hypothetical protein